MKALYLTGGPAVGKSAIMSRLTSPYGRIESTPDEGQPRREWLFQPAHRHDPGAIAVELGARAGKHPAGFPGTDAMAMSAIVPVEKWIVSGVAAAEAPVLLGEGARLGVRRFVEALMAAEIETHVVLVTASPDIVERRCQERGSHQKESWMRGQFTRSRNFFEYAEHAALERPLLHVHEMSNLGSAGLQGCAERLAEIIGW